MRKTFFRLRWNPKFVTEIEALSALPIPPEKDFDSREAAEDERQARSPEAFLIEPFEKEVA